MSCTAFPTGQPPNMIGGTEITQFGWMTYTNPFNLTGQPAASVPCGFDSRGLPVGLHVIGRAYEDSVVLRVARAFEQAQPWADKRPAMAS
jgi:aspartyl-tRNA(Asn)/glutamyl-tRNA(Gln) amidotransferase subunit A